MTRRRRSVLAALGLPVLLGAGACRADPLPVDVTVQGLQRSSSWTETTPSGRRLLREHGTLSGAGVESRWTFPWGALQAGVQHLSGTRDYTGETSSGTPVQTDAGLRIHQLTASLRPRLAPHWEGHATVDAFWLERQLHSVGTAQGYTERWRWALGMIGVTTHRTTSAGTWSLGGEVGAPLGTRVRMNLPGTDEITLRPTARPAWRARVEGRSLPLHWGAMTTTLHIGLAVQEIAFGASDPVAVTSSGSLRGSVFQPDTRQHDQTLSIGLTSHW